MKKPTTPESMAGPHSRKSTKTRTILEVFVSGRTLNRFEAERLGDHTLNSTISTLVNAKGLVFIRHTEEVPNRFGTLTRVTRYRLANHSKKRALALLGGARP